MRLTSKNGSYCGDCGLRDDYCRCDLEIALYEKMKQYENAEEEGRLVILPCKVGDMVYKICVNTEACYDCEHYSHFYGMDELCDINIDALYPNPTGIDEPLCEKQFFEIIQYCATRNFILINIDNFGKTVFLTRTEAEAALKGEENDG